MQIPLIQQAVQQNENNTLKVAHDVPLPTPDPGYILIKTAAVSLQPADLNLFTNFPLPGALGGVDLSGTVVNLGRDVDPATVQVGDRVGAGAFTFSRDHRLVNGAFAEYVQVRPYLVLRLPPTTTNEKNTSRQQLIDLATLSTAISTCILSFWRPGSLELTGTPARPFVSSSSSSEEPSPSVLVYGGSTSVGTIAIQLLVQSGYAVITTCSPHNFPLVKSRGATAVFDHTSPDVAAEISRCAGDRLRYVVDCIGDDTSVDICYRAIQRPGGRYVVLQHVVDGKLARRRAVTPLFVLAAEAFGEDIDLGSSAYDRPASEEVVRLIEENISMVQREVLDPGKLVPHPVEILEGGMEAVVEGLDLLATKGVSGKKLVVVLDHAQLEGDVS